MSRQDHEGAAALMYLLAHNNDITVVKNTKNLMLMFKADVDRTFTPGIAAAIGRSGALANPGEDLINEQ